MGCQSQNDEADTDGSPDDTDTDDGGTGDTDTDLGDTDTDDTGPPAEDLCTFSQCGGDVVGTWNILGMCLDLPSEYEALCPAATSVYTFDTTGTWVFDVAGTYAIDATIASTLTTTLPAECNGDVTECAEWEVVESPLTECTGDVAVECICTATSPPVPTTDSGTWSYVGEDVRMLSDLGGGAKGTTYPMVYEVCLEGDRLQLELNMKGFFPVGFTLER